MANISESKGITQSEPADAPYVTIKGEGVAEYEEKRSRFIGYARPAKNEEEALEFIAAIKKRHCDARHNVWAYVTDGRRSVRYSDDGEPQGSAGMPVLEYIKKHGICDAVVVVTRYFGGTLLGVGGLVRAYTKAAAAAVESAGIISLELFSEYTLSCGYADYRRVAFELGLFDTIIDSVDYAEDVKIRFSVRKGSADTLCSRIVDVLEGRAVPQKCGERYDSI